MFLNRLYPCAIAAMVALTGCVGGIASNELQIDNDGNGRFSGHAGPDWTADELRAQVGGAICDGAAPATFDARILSGNWLFSGSC